MEIHSFLPLQICLNSLKLQGVTLAKVRFGMFKAGMNLEMLGLFSSGPVRNPVLKQKAIC